MYLHGPWLTDAGLRHLAVVPGLVGLELTGTGVGDGAVDDLARMKGLRVLSLTGSRVTPAGRQALAKALPGCQIVNGPE